MNDLIGNPAAFPVLDRWTYLNHAGVGPLPKVSADAMRAFVDADEAGAYLGVDWFGDMDKARANLAGLVNADPGEIAFVQNTAQAVSTVAFGLDWSPGDRVVTAAVEYPANVYPWMEIARAKGVELVLVPEYQSDGDSRSVPVDELLKAADHPKTKLLTISHVQFASGQRFDLAQLGAFCRERGILFNVDGIQSLGIFPIDVKAMNIDFVGACGHKWLLGPPGAGFLFVRKDLHDRVRPTVIGATSVVNFLDYGSYDFTLRPDAGRYESGTPNLTGIAGLNASVALLRSVGIENISARIKSLTDRLVDGLNAKGYGVVSPRDDQQWSGNVCFTTQKNQVEIFKSLNADHRIEIALREKRLRASPHFYNTEVQVDRLMEALPDGQE